MTGGGGWGCGSGVPELGCCCANGLPIAGLLSVPERPSQKGTASLQRQCRPAPAGKPRAAQRAPAHPPAPRCIHEYQLTPHSLYAAVSIGLETDTIVAVLNRLSKNVLPPEIKRFVRGCTQNYGKAGPEACASPSARVRCYANFE